MSINRPLTNTQQRRALINRARQAPKVTARRWIVIDWHNAALATCLLIGAALIGAAIAGA